MDIRTAPQAPHSGINHIQSPIKLRSPSSVIVVPSNYFLLHIVLVVIVKFMVFTVQQIAHEMMYVCACSSVRNKEEMVVRQMNDLYYYCYIG
jgi:hypothetical protein